MDMKQSHIMLDIETLATGPNAVMLTIGAIRFDPFADDINSYEDKTIKMDTFYRRVDPASFDWPEAEIDDNTLAWWSKQASEVKEEAFTEVDRHDVRAVMQDFYKWSSQGFHTVWANGPVFDIVILENINKRIQRGNAWKYWQVKDARTVYGLVEHHRPDQQLHHALWDCWSQIVALQSCFRNLNITAMPGRK